MTKQEFKAFYNTVSKADKNHDIWWCGFYFMHCTSSQINRLKPILAEKFGVTEGKIVLPSGISIRMEV